MKTKREPETIDTVMDYVGSDIISYTENYLEDMKVINHSTMIPLYFSSVGAHIVNLLNIACAKDGGSFCPFYAGPTCGRHGSLTFVNIIPSIVMAGGIILSSVLVPDLEGSAGNIF